jgi:DNA-binding transcriptional LysR family regulator
MPVPGLDETNAFMAVLDGKSFSKAAKQLGLSAPRISELVRKLEERLGVRLIERTTRSVAATPAGELLFDRLRPALDDYQAALEAAGEFRNKPAGTLRLTVAPPAADFALGPVLRRFLSAYPEINLDIDISSGLTDIVSGRFDAGIRPAKRLTPGMVALRISDEMPRVVVAAPDYLARRGRPKTPQDLLRHDCIRFRMQSGEMLPWLFRINGQAKKLPVQGRLIVNDPRFAFNAAIAGAGLFQVPLGYVASKLSTGDLVTVLDDWPSLPVDGFYLYHPSRRHIRAPLKALIDFLRDARRGGTATARTTRSGAQMPPSSR